MNAIQTVTPRPPSADDAPLTIAQFCERYGISKYIYYRMRAKGETPRETTVSARRRVILAASLREWERNKLLADTEP